MLAIYSTLGLARTLAAEQGDLGLGAGLFLVCCLLVVATALTQGLRVRPGGVEIAVALGVIAAYLLVFVRMSIPTERSHLIEYGVVALFVHEALTERASHGRRVPAPALLAVLATSLIGVIDEGHPAVPARPRVRPSGHAVQRPGRRDGGGSQLGVALGAAAERVAQERSQQVALGDATDYGRKVTLMVIRVSTGTRCSSVGS